MLQAQGENMYQYKSMRTGWFGHIQVKFMIQTAATLSSWFP